MKMPRDIESENVILSICLTRPDFLPKVRESIGPQHFFDEQNRKIFVQMEELYEEDKAFAAQDLAQKAGVSTSKVSELIGYTPVVDPAPYCTTVLDSWQRREAIRVVDRFQSELLQKKGAKEIISEYMGELIGLFQQGTATRLFSLEEAEGHVLGRTLAEKVHKITAWLCERGYMAQWQESGPDKYFIKLMNCPIAQVAKRFSHACLCEQELLSEVLGAKVERQHYILQEDHFCSYLVERK